MNRKHIAVLAAIPLVLTGLAACGSNGQDDAASASPSSSISSSSHTPKASTSTRSTPITATSPSDLRDQLTGLGLSCLSWDESLEQGLAGTCKGNYRLVVNGGPGDPSWDELFDGNTDLFKMLVGSGQYAGLKMIIAPTWYAMVPSNQASQLAAASGATAYNKASSGSTYGA